MSLRCPLRSSISLGPLIPQCPSQGLHICQQVTHIGNMVLLGCALGLLQGCHLLQGKSKLKRSTYDALLISQGVCLLRAVMSCRKELSVRFGSAPLASRAVCFLWGQNSHMEAKGTGVVLAICQHGL